MTSPRRLPALVGLTATLLTVSLAGCVRLETPAPPARTASPVTVERDTLAAALDDVSTALAEGSDGGTLAQVEARSLPSLVDGVGQRYVTYPGVTPSASASASASADPVTLDSVVQAALDTSVEIATSTDDADLRAWATSGALVHGMALWLGLVDDGSVDTGAAARTLPSSDAAESLTVPDSSALDSTTLADLALRHDQARYLYELVATRQSGAEKAASLARAELHAERSDALQELSGADDARTEVYSTLASSIEDDASRAATLRDTEDAVASAYAAAAVSSESGDVAWLLDGAFDAYAAESLLDGWRLTDLPVLPGLADASSAEDTQG
ncbi:hypothetical protein [Demequina salsinemoris]|uniref:hypothetical protein n=1 Tax=Demequina salsinemoris TaxID=577470 RepID=UPI00128DBEE8|nr:hypothetical protein [Demequina salsinemoris]